MGRATGNDEGTTVLPFVRRCFMMPRKGTGLENHIKDEQGAAVRPY
jgi:hypothetical protein